MGVWENVSGGVIGIEEGGPECGWIVGIGSGCRELRG